MISKLHEGLANPVVRRRWVDTIDPYHHRYDQRRASRLKGKYPTEYSQLLAETFTAIFRAMAESSQPRPSRSSRLGIILKKYLARNPALRDELIALGASNWFIDSDANKTVLVEWIRQHGRKPLQTRKDDEERRIGQLLNNYTGDRPGNETFDQEFKDQLAADFPFLFVSSKEIAQKEIIAFIITHGRKPSQSSVDPIERRLAANMHAYANPKKGQYDAAFTAHVESLIPSRTRDEYFNELVSFVEANGKPKSHQRVAHPTQEQLYERKMFQRWHDYSNPGRPSYNEAYAIILHNLIPDPPAKQIKEPKRRSKTTKRFIDDAHKVHGDSYSYDHVSYIDNDTEVDIGCRKHGLFSQRPRTHLSGSGCPKCAAEEKALINREKRAFTAEDFVCKAREVHGDSYRYDKVVYINNHTSVVITCEIHGDFTQTPQNHLARHGCTECGLVNAISQRRASSRPVAANSLPPLDYLKERLEYNPDTGVFTWKRKSGEGRDIKIWNTRFAGTKAGYVRGDGYLAIRIDGQHYAGHRIAWFLMTGEDPTVEIKQADGNKANVVWSNLRISQ